MRRTIYKEFDKESQDMLLQLTSKQHIIEILCAMFWAVAFIFTYIPVFIIDVCEGYRAFYDYSNSNYSFYANMHGGITSIYEGI